MREKPDKDLASWLIPIEPYVGFEENQTHFYTHSTGLLQLKDYVVDIF